MADQATNNTQTAAIGEVQSVTGRVVAVGADGVERQLFAGDMVFADDLVKTVGDSSIVIAMNDGTRVDLGNDAEAMLDDSVYGDESAVSAAAIADIKEIQEAIAAGADPTEVADPTAAGGDQAAASSAADSAQSALSVDRTGRVGLVEAGFETSTAGQNVDPILVDPIPLTGGDAGGGTAGAAPVVPPSASIVLASITADNILNAAEAGGPVAISGTVVGDVSDGDTVFITVNGVDYSGVVTGGVFSILVPGSELLADADGVVEARFTTNTGSPAGETTATDTQSFSSDTTPPTASITLDPVTDDNIVNAAESGGTVVISGSVGGDVADGDVVTVTVDGIDYTGTVTGGTFAIDVPGSALAADADTTIEASVTTSTGDVNGETTAVASRTYGVDTAAPTATLTLDAITADNIIDAAESGGTVAVTGTVGGDLTDGDIVTLTVNGIDYTGPVAGGSFSISVPGSELVADGDVTVEASATTSTGDVNGETTATDAQTYSVDTTAPTATLVLDPIAGDNVLDAAEAGATVAITGSVGGDVVDGDTVTVSVNGVDYTASVSGGLFSVNVPGSELASDGDAIVDASVTTSTGDVNGEATATAPATSTAKQPQRQHSPIRSAPA